jgi:hypothetical protein
MDSESESRAFHLFARAWTRSQSPGRFTCSRGHGLGVRVQGVSLVRAGMDSESESRAFHLFARACTRSQSLGPGKCVTGRIFLDSESESRTRKVRYGTCLPGLGVRVQGVTGVSLVRAGMDSDSESRAFWAFHLFARAWTRIRSPGRSGRFTCSRGHGLGVWVSGSCPTHPHGADFPVGSWTFEQPRQRRPAATRPQSPGFACAHTQIYPHESGRFHQWIRSDPVTKRGWRSVIRSQAGLACGVEVFGRPAPRRNSIEAIRLKSESPPPRRPAPQPHL